MTKKKGLELVGPGLVLCYQAFLMLASIVALLWFTAAPGRALQFSWDDVVPLWVPFGGWLGGITISIVGVATHTHDWNRQKYGYWHLARPLLGSLTGTVAVLIVLFIVEGISDNAVPRDGEAYEPSGIAVLFVLAFVVGYREETFRGLVKRVLDVILTPGDNTAEQRVALLPALTTLNAKHGTTAATTLALVNTTSDTFDISLVTPQLDPPVNDLNVGWAPSSTQLGPGQSVQLTLTWSPQAPDPSADTKVVVTVGGYRVTSAVRLTVQP